MRKTNFSENETKYLSGNSADFSDNYIYQLRHSIREKVTNFTRDDLLTIVKFDQTNRRGKRKRKRLIDSDLLGYLVKEILKIYPNFVLKVGRIPEVRKYLGLKKLEEVSPVNFKEIFQDLRK